MASQVALAADNALDYYQVAESRQRLAEERVYLNEEIRIARLRRDALPKRVRETRKEELFDAF